MPSLARLITESSLRQLADERSFERGVTYVGNGAVERLVCRKDRISARVVGTDVYTVKLWPEGRRLGWSCTCPVGEDGEFCKHLVATGLTWLATKSEDKQEHGSPDMDTISRFLEASDKQELVDMLMEYVCDDDELAANLLLAAQRHGVSDPRALKETIRKAFASSGFVDYNRMREVAARARPVPELLEERLKQGDARTVAELSADAMKRGLKVLENSDDSDGLLGDVLSAIAGVHVKAAKQGGLSQSELAKNLFDLQLADGYGFFELEDYLTALGKDGVVAYRRLAAAAWEKVPPRRPGARTDGDNDRRYQVAEIMKTLARMDGDVDGLVGVLQRDLSEPYAWFEIVEVLSKAKRHDEALKWAQEAREAVSGKLNIPLDDFLVAEYHRRKRHDDAVALRWSRFTEHPSLQNYQHLHAAASKAKNWAAWREKALAVVDKPETRKAQSGYALSWIESNASVLIQIFLWEGNPRAALENARAAGCGTYLWLQIAQALEADSPENAIAVYADQIDPIVKQTNNQAYDEAAEIVRRVRELTTRIGKGGEFAGWIDELRARHKAKRNFMQRLVRIAGEARKQGAGG
jgi:uncharacterized Zn finger protein